MKKKIDLNNLPIYDITIDEDENQGIRFVSLVKDPAIDIKAMCFSKEQIEAEIEYQFKKVKDKQLLVGPAMVPNKKILRKNPDNPEDMYYVRFSKEIIQQMVNIFNRENNNKSINVEHTDTMVNAYIQQNWIIESMTYDKSKMYGFNNLPIGTWFIIVQVQDEDFWQNEVIDAGRYGFSIEGYMGQALVSMKKHQPEAIFDYYNIMDSLSEKEFYDLFVDLEHYFFEVGDVDYHPHCNCEIEVVGQDELGNDQYLWIVNKDTVCDECKEMQQQFNNEQANGNGDFAMQIYKKHKGL